MIILAWIAIGIPVLIVLLFILDTLTDGFEDWLTLMAMIIMAALIVSFFWGVIYVNNHKTNQPVQVERQ